MRIPLRTRISAGPAVLAFLVAFAPLCRSQKVELVRDIALAESDYRDANEAWLKNDPGLAGDLFKGDPEDVRRRIHKAAALRDDAMAKQQTYLQLVIERLQDTRRRLTQASQGAIPTAAFKKDLESQQSRVLDEQERVEGLLRDLPEGDEYLLVRRALNEDRSNLVALQNDVAVRIRFLESTGKAQEAIQAAAPADSLAQKFDDLLKIWDEESAGAVRQRSKWADLYKAMETSLDQKEPAKKGSPNKGGGANTPKGGKEEDENPNAPVVPLAVVKASAPLVIRAGMAGTWTYRSQLGAWTGYGEPEAVTLELDRKGGEWIGVYTARLPGRSGVRGVRLALAGAPQSEGSVRLRWKSQTPAAEGEMEIRLSGDGRLLVERALSDDSYIPRGMEVLLRQ
jgi:hypothetical protein